ncbi:MAG: hypothetical protein GXX79_15230 [Actinomycetales bacterium]|nr:hypothetical protein [Actinomycetales bacterium]
MIGIVLGVLVLVIGGVVGGATYLSGHREKVQRTEYRAGHAAYLRADCEQAVGHLRRAMEHRPDRDIAVRTGQELQACQALLAARRKAVGAEPADALNVYLGYLSDSRAETLRLAVQRQVITLVEDVTPKDLVAADLCANLDEIEKAVDEALAAEGKVEPEITDASLTVAAGSADVRSTWLPPMLSACGKAWQKEGLDDRALEAFLRLRKEYPTSSFAGKVLPDIVEISYRVARENGKTLMFDLMELGTLAAGGREAQVALLNCTPMTASIMVAGPEAVSRTAKRSPGAKVYATYEQFASRGCPAGSTVARFWLLPGRYKVVIDLGEGRILYGDWTLRKAKAYITSVAWIRQAS